MLGHAARRPPEMISFARSMILGSAGALLMVLRRAVRHGFPRAAADRAPQPTAVTCCWQIVTPSQLTSESLASDLPYHNCRLGDLIDNGLPGASRQEVKL